MTFEDLLECDIETLEKMNDSELREHFKQYFPTTRPELVKLNRTTKSNNNSSQSAVPMLSDKKKAFLSALAEQGEDIGDMMARLKRRK